ncbi:MAG: tRNA pseudouridine(38-40) synthase TruA [Firmicutes bacterium]|nr:tRNA pseudouridine(38-40) synthase TruA [Bacillota bacterium]
MVNYKLTLSYDGSFFAGFQIQRNPEIQTIQGELQRVLSLIFDTPIKIHAAGRTDTGVHATQQVISFRHERLMKEFNLRRAANGLLNGPIAIQSVEYEKDDFNARYSARCRHYIYILDNNPYPDALLHTRAYWYPLPLNVEKMNTGAKLFEGKHDFRNFAKGLEDIETTERRILKAGVFSSDSLKNTLNLNHTTTPTYTNRIIGLNNPFNDNISIGDPNIYHSHIHNNLSDGNSTITQEIAPDAVTNMKMETETTDNQQDYNPADNEFIQLLNTLIVPQGNIIYFYFKGEAFLHSMVRLMVSTLIELGKEKITENQIKSMLDCTTGRLPRIMNIPGKGLYLVKVDY